MFGQYHFETEDDQESISMLWFLSLSIKVLILLITDAAN
jgi:hypothetical protein